LRSAGSLIQTMGRASRHIAGRAILYADRITDSMRRAIDETDRRRTIQRAYNEEHGITPQSIISPVDMGLAAILKAEYGDVEVEETAGLPEFSTQAELDSFIAKLETEMRESAKKFEFERAARLRDSIKELREKEFLFG
jgi:excinuclease ABC subunit B